jgi:hypothetical protein
MRRAAVRLEGSLDTFGLPDIFGLLVASRKTGALYVQSAARRGVVHFADGQLSGGSADVSRQSLARRLLALATVTDADLDEAIRAAALDQTVGVARALADGGAVPTETLQAAVAEQIHDAVFDLVRWSEGRFGFEPGEPNPDDSPVRLSVDVVLAEAHRRAESWAVVTAVVPSPETVLSVAANSVSDQVLSPEDWSLLTLVDGQRTVADLVTLLGRGEFAVVSALARLVERGLLQDSPDGGPAARLLRQHAALEAIERGEPVSPSVPRPRGAKSAAPLGPVDRSAQAVSTMVPVVVPAATRPVDVEPSEPVPVVVGSSAVVAEPVLAEPEVSDHELAALDPGINRSMVLRLIAGVQEL